MIRRWIRKYTPAHHTIQQQRWVRPFAKHLSHPSIWAVNRRTISGAVAAGLFCGLVPGPLQMVAALLWVIVARVNLPVALIVTLYTNPLTIIPLYAVALAYGQWILSTSSQHSMNAMPMFLWSDFSGSCKALMVWFIGFGPALFIGVLALALTLSVLGYALTRFAFFLYLASRNRRCKRK